MSVRPLIILGCGATHAECRYEYETWGVNGTYTFAKRLDKLFMTDGPDQVLEDVVNAYKIRKFGCPLILADRFPGITEDFEKAGVEVQVFPIDDVLKKFPTKFYSNTIAYMIAYALLKTQIAIDPVQSSPYQTETARTSSIQSIPIQSIPRVIDGYNKIYFYGIDLMTNSCYIQEKGGVEYWMGIALGMGIEVINTRGSATGKTWNGRMYGWWGDSEDERSKERLLAPWELVRAAPGPKPIDEWVKEGENWVKVPYVVK